MNDMHRTRFQVEPPSRERWKPTLEGSQLKSTPPESFMFQVLPGHVNRGQIVARNPWLTEALSVSYRSRVNAIAQMTLPGVSASVRFFFAFFRQFECYRDFSPNTRVLMSTGGTAALQSHLAVQFPAH